MQICIDVGHIRQYYALDLDAEVNRGQSAKLFTRTGNQFLKELRFSSKCYLPTFLVFHISLVCLLRSKYSDAISCVVLLPENKYSYTLIIYTQMKLKTNIHYT